MIVADTNTIAYLYLPSDFSHDCERALVKDSIWAAPLLWRSELRNILSVYVRKELIEISDAYDIQREAEHLLNGNEFEVDSLSVIKLARESGCSAYDCEFIYLAQNTGSKLITEDKKILKSFPDLALTAKEFVNS
ncbi:MAG: type II toxin-antitoxin system VapC family toxin [Gammaproteobacteria bacterium]|jgi:predicted nucleic acid-binding protein